MNSNCILDIRNLAYTYPSGEVIFKNLNLQINKGEFVILLGKNGSGKSTLLNLLLGLRHPLQGSVSVLGQSPYNNKRHKLFKSLFFNSHDLNFDENSRVGYILDNYKILYPNYNSQREEDLLIKFGLDRDKYVYELSTGMKARIQFIAAICSEVEFILMDEITAVLDRDARKLLGEELAKECKRGRSVLMATNIPEDTTFNSNRVVMIQDMELCDEAA
ncbi:ATP-binding cassette domain-containing protein [Halobacteriovorax sp. DPLXC-1]|uniref:ATP-binding cassette domain-containing protein n=1 Tax=Halobacteriovorax sp. DPLXC-1 TaxID=3110771 RepID=UPI002FF36FDB